MCKSRKLNLVFHVTHRFTCKNSVVGNIQIDITFVLLCIEFHMDGNRK